jgi:hypothetical protein
VERGVTVRRVRALPVPLDPGAYMAWEMAVSDKWNVPVGREDIRVLQLTEAHGLPAHDFWVIDDRVWLMTYGPDREFLGVAPIEDQALTAAHHESRDIAWSRSQEWHATGND